MLGGEKRELVIGLYFQGLARKGGGAERMLCWLANGLAANGYEVHILTWDQEFAESFYPLAPEIHWHRLGFCLGLRDKFRRMLAIRHVLKTQRIDTLIGFVMAGDMTVFTAAWTCGVRIIAAERNAPSMYNHLYTPLRRWLNLSMLFLADCIVLQSEAFRSGYSAALKDRIVTIPNPVPQPTRLLEAAEIKGERRIVLYVGRLDPLQKRPHLLVMAFAKIASVHTEWDLLIVGDGDAWVDLAKQIVVLGLQSRVHLVHSTFDIGTIYERSDLFVIPSCWEGFPNALAEAMSYGLPAIGFADCEGVATFLEKSGGWLVPSRGSHEDLAYVMDMAMADPEDRHRRGVDARLAMTDFDPNRVMTAWVQAIEGCTGQTWQSEL